MKDEAESLERTIRSVLAQTRRPAHWVIVDDGSVDATGAIADAVAREHPWISVVHRPAGPPGRAGTGAIDAFHMGLRRADVKDYDFIGKIDGGLEFSPEYFATLMRQFASDPRLGAIGAPA